MQVNEDAISTELKNDTFVNPGGEALSNLFANMPDKGNTGEGTEKVIVEDDEFEEKKPAIITKVEDDEEEVVKKEEVKKEEDDKTATVIAEDSILNLLATEFGEVELEQDEATDDSDGVINYFKKREERIIPEYKKQGIQELFEALPLVREFAEHINNGLGVESFKAERQPQEFKEVNIEEAETDVLESVYRNALKAKGTDDEEIEELIETARDSNKLKDRAEKAQKYLKTQHEERIENQKTKEKAESKAIEDAELETAKAVKEVLKNKKIGNISLTQEQTTKLENHLFGKAADGSSTRDTKWANITLEQQLILDYIVANDFKDTGFAQDKSEINKKKLITIKKKAEADKTVDLKTKSGGLDVKGLFSNIN